MSDLTAGRLTGVGPTTLVRARYAITLCIQDVT